MKWQRLLLPFGLLYGLITWLRNQFYNWGWLHSQSFDVPVIAIGNLSMGGTGKTPMTEYLIHLLQNDFKIAVLSRGYRRTSKGFVLATSQSKVHELGDEPFQIFRKFPQIHLAVDADRCHGIQQLLTLPDAPTLILLDDAYQHRAVKAKAYVLLTAYGDLFADDAVVPAGSLREFSLGKKRAQVVVVTKCPPNLTEKEQQQIIGKLGVEVPVFFSKIAFSNEVVFENGNKELSALSEFPKLLVAGIAKPQTFFDHLKQPHDLCLTFPDHHTFTEDEIKTFTNYLSNSYEYLITTEKDEVRLKGLIPAHQLGYLPVTTQFVAHETAFQQLVRRLIID
ncbi:MAG: tetraacyldisaccharide 4'-kinase [Flavobacterium sp. BFFFF2]|nr:MAG: tetraacyldisaccharide 4'-kinase [Flavobacterium sp. BFFFF2]